MRDKMTTAEKLALCDKVNKIMNRLITDDIIPLACFTVPLNSAMPTGGFFYILDETPQLIQIVKSIAVRYLTTSSDYDDRINIDLGPSNN